MKKNSSVLRLLGAFIFALDSAAFASEAVELSCTGVIFAKSNHPRKCAPVRDLQFEISYVLDFERGSWSVADDPSVQGALETSPDFYILAPERFQEKMMSTYPVFIGKNDYALSQARTLISFQCVYQYKSQGHCSVVKKPDAKR